LINLEYAVNDIYDLSITWFMFEGTNFLFLSKTTKVSNVSTHKL